MASEANSKKAICWLNGQTKSFITDAPFECQTSAGKLRVNSILPNFKPDGSIEYRISGEIVFNKQFKNVKSFVEPVRSDYLKKRPWLADPFVSSFGSYFKNAKTVSASEKIPLSGFIITKPSWALADRCALNTVIARVYLTSLNTNIGEV